VQTNYEEGMNRDHQGGMTKQVPGPPSSKGPGKEKAAQEDSPIINLVSQDCDAEGVRDGDGVQISPTSMNKEVQE
jgi:hypothetical protein